MHRPLMHSLLPIAPDALDCNLREDELSFVLTLVLILVRILFSIQYTHLTEGELRFLLLR